ncbi:MAG: hypothetical protein Q7Q73_09105 [Verrucomicrobiota bacterium JB024]|nr:hypothetical protein [Verrucomicrobiota bacterium JB024]
MAEYTFLEWSLTFLSTTQEYLMKTLKTKIFTRCPHGMLLLALLTGFGSFRAEAQTIVNFEAEEGYTAGQTLIGQPTDAPHWLDTNSGNDSQDGTGQRTVLTGGTPGVQSGSNYAVLTRASSEDSTALGSRYTFTEEPLTTEFSASATLAYAGSLSSNGNLYFALSSSSGNNYFNGIAVGFLRVGSTIEFGYRDGATWIGLGTDILPSTNTYYTFDLEVDPIGGTYDLTIYDTNGSLLITQSDIGIRGGVTSFDMMVLRIANANVGAALYADSISVIPESNAYALLLGLVGLVSLVWRGRFRQHKR